MTTVLGILAVISFTLFLWQFIVGARFRFDTAVPGIEKSPGVTILKPLKGADSQTEACLRTWLEQDYAGPIQLLFGVGSADDPARQLTNAVVCPARIGANAKVSTLAQLEPLIKHDLIVVSDADVAVPKDFLTRLAAFVQSEDASVASCPYKLSGAANLPMRLEAFIVNSDFWSQVLQSIALKPMDFALGAVMAVRRKELAQLGGFRSLADYLADDYQLGKRANGKVALCPIIVECRSGLMGWRDVWSHQLRWARTIRVCQPAPFFFSILSNTTLWLGAWAASGPWLPALAMLALRSLGGGWLERKFTGRFLASSLIIAPLSDFLRAVFWLLAFAGNRVHWRGNWFRVSRGGKLTPERAGG